MPPIAIRTRRLILRSPQARDLAAILNLHTNPANLAFDRTPPGPPPTLSSFEPKISEWRAMADRMERIFMIVAIPSNSQRSEFLGSNVRLGYVENEVQDDVVIGITGFNEFVKRDEDSCTEVPHGKFKSTNVGVMIDAAYCRNGYASEALSAILDIGFDHFGCDFIAADTMATNVPFMALMARLGLAACGNEVTGRERGTEMEYAVNREEWIRARATLCEANRVNK
ncbi:hypothetical protein BZG36_05396 [Bifiguratus adelaidae]|uniref:N-acetyltransferase domain-containing protein n=1 Tax=Bifiguratus adelaidae TaxID=1938954 RepID=A0A261XUA7_9FUNG|nr:hypothetical protein BZG36_05396 [Bifiguratus adelaidae]